jgi:hypothetical protein
MILCNIDRGIARARVGHHARQEWRFEESREIH